MVLTSHHPLLTVIKQPVITMGIYRRSENDGSECVWTQQGAAAEKCVKEKCNVVKNRLYKWLSNSKHTNLSVSENISLAFTWN